MSGNPHVPGISGHPFVGKGSVTYCPGCDLGIVALEADTLGVITGGGGRGREEEGEEEMEEGRKRGSRGRGLQQTRLPCPCLSPRVFSCLLTHMTIELVMLSNHLDSSPGKMHLWTFSF